jgi:hypothetical protein
VKEPDGVDVARGDAGEVAKAKAGGVERGVPSPGAERADLSLDKERCSEAVLGGAAGFGTGGGAAELVVGAADVGGAAGGAEGL